MSKKKRRSQPVRDAPAVRTFLCSTDAWNVLSCDGYRPLSACPEVRMCVDIYANLISSMTVYLMENTDIGDIRIKNELSRKLDIEPNPLMTRKQLIHCIVRTLLLDGDGNQFTAPVYKDGYLESLVPLKPSAAIIQNTPNGYVVKYGEHTYNPDELLHFVINPDPEEPWKGTGYRVVLSDVVTGLRQAGKTKQALMESPAPSLVVKIDSNAEELATPKGQQILADRYLSNTRNGKPWMIPAELMDVQQVKPLTLNDLAIKSNMELDKRTVAGLFGVPPFLVGVGNYSAEEYNNFISSRIMPLAKGIEQEMTRKLLISPNWYIRFNYRSLYSYSIDQIVTAGSAMVDRMAMSRNEWRDWAGIAPRADMEELLALENYIPVDRLGDQKKLNEGGEGNA